MENAILAFFETFFWTFEFLRYKLKQCIIKLNEFTYEF